ATQCKAQRGEIQLAELGIVQHGIKERVHPRNGSKTQLGHVLDHGGNVACVNDQEVLRTQTQKHQQVRGESEDMVERQGSNNAVDLAFFQIGANPGQGLAQV